MSKFNLFNSCSVNKGLSSIVSRGNHSFMRFFGVLLLLLLGSVVSWGQIAAWDFFGQSSPATFTATTFNSNLVLSSGANNITRGSSAASSAASNSFRTTGFQNNGISTSNTDYFQITLTAATGYKLSLSTIDAKYSGTQTFVGTLGVSSQFAYSLNGTSFTLIGSPFTLTGTVPISMSQIDLSGISTLQNVAAGTTITLRYYASGQTTTGGWGFLSATTSGTNGLAIGGTVTLASSVTNPSAFSATTFSSSQINLATNANGNSNNIVVVTNSTGTFTTPTDGTAPTAVGTTLAGSGGTIVYAGSAASLGNHTGLIANTAYFYKAFSYDASNIYSGGITANATTAKIEPTNQPTSFQTNIIVTQTNIPIVWTSAASGSQAPDGYLVKLSTGSISDPVDGTDTGAGSMGIIDGTATYKATTGVTFSNAVAGTMYNVKIYSYTNSGTLIDFNTTSAPALSVAALPNPVTSGSITATGSTTANITWTAANNYINENHSTLVFVKETNSITTGTPFNSPSTYTANSAFGSGTAYQNDAAATCVFNGDGTNVSVTGLSPNTTYHVLIYTVVDAANSNSKNAYSSATSANATTNNLATPIATAATSNSTNGFTANWETVEEASGYKLDIATTNDFISATETNVVGWTFSPYSLSSDIGNSNNSNSNSKTLNTVGGTSVITTTGSSPNIAASATGWNSGTGTKYWQISDINTIGMYNMTLSSDQQSSGTGPKEFKVQYKIGSGGTWIDVSNGVITITSSSNLTSLTNLVLPLECENKSSIYLRWIMTSNTSQNDAIVQSGGTSRITHIYIKNKDNSNILGYNDLSVFDNSQSITGLTPNTTYYYRVRAVGGNSTSANSNTITAATSSTIEVNTSTPASTLPVCPTCDVTVASAGALTIDASKTYNSVTVAPGGKLTLANGETLTAPITLQSNASGTGTFVDENTADVPPTVSGTVEQYLSSARNWYISSSVASAQSEDLPAGTLWKYNEPNTGVTANPGSTLWDVITSNEELELMNGYIFKPSAAGTVSFTGDLNTGDKSIVINRTENGKASRGFNLVGNPYPSFIDIDNLASNPDLVPTVWYRSYNEGYVFDTYNIPSGLTVGLSGNAVTKNIPPMQAFWVRVASGKTSATVNLLNANRGHQDNSNNKFRAPAAHTSDNQVLRLKVVNGSKSDEALIYFNAKAVNGYDIYDSPKMLNGTNSTVPDMYTLAGAEQLVINGMNAIPTEIPLYIKANASTASQFSLSATEISNFEADTKVYIKNNMTGEQQLISDGTVYTYDATTVGTDPAFSIIIKAPGTISGLGNINSSLLIVSANASRQITVTTPSIKGNGESSVTVHNAIGQKLIAKKLTSTSTVLDIPNASGVYLVTVINAGNKITRKVILN